jgi:hypothetical protein
MSKLLVTLALLCATSVVEARGADITSKEIAESSQPNMVMTVTMEQARKIVLSACVAQHGAIVAEGPSFMRCVYYLPEPVVVSYTLVSARDGILVAWASSDRFMGRIISISLRRVYKYAKANYIK